MKISQMYFTILKRSFSKKKIIKYSNDVYEIFKEFLAAPLRAKKMFVRHEKT